MWAIAKAVHPAVGQGPWFYRKGDSTTGVIKTDNLWSRQVLWAQVMQMAHDHLRVAGHQETDCTLVCITDHFYLPGICAQVQCYNSPASTLPEHV